MRHQGRDQSADIEIGMNELLVRDGAPSRVLAQIGAEEVMRDSSHEAGAELLESREPSTEACCRGHLSDARHVRSR